MGEVIEIHKKRLFSIEEANQLLPVIRRWTKTSADEIQKISAQLAFVQEPTLRRELENKVQSLFSVWQSKIIRLGCEAKGMWLVDFDSGQGFYCWKYPENNVGYFHGYFEGFRGRVRLH